jgi:hypothetical protein
MERAAVECGKAALDRLTANVAELARLFASRR